MNETQATVLIIIVGVGVLVHIVTMIAMYGTVRASSTRLKAVADKIESRALPVLEAAQSLVIDSRPKIEGIIENLGATTTTLRGQIERLDATVNDIVDRTRLQVIRADELVARTIDRVEETSEFVQHTVVSPIRHASGLLQGLTAGLGMFFGRSRRRREAGVPQDELFI